MINCPICISHSEKKEILMETSHWILRKAPGTKELEGYFYLETKRHVDSWPNLKEEECLDYGLILHKALSLSLQFPVAPEKIYFAAIAEQVPHLHVHLVPRYPGQEKGIKHLEIALGPGFSKPL